MRKIYTIDNKTIEKCSGAVFEFWNPTVEKLPGYIFIKRVLSSTEN